MPVLRWNLFRGGSDRAQERAFAERRYAGRSIRPQTRAATWKKRSPWRSTRKRPARSAWPACRSTPISAWKYSTPTSKQLDLGWRTLLDVLNAENEVFTARSNLTAGRSVLARAHLKAGTRPLELNWVVLVLGRKSRQAERRIK